MKKKEKTILAAYPRPYKTRVADSADTFLLMLNRIVGTRFTTLKKPIQLLKEMPALKIANKDFYSNAIVHLKVNLKFEVASTEEILQRQSAFMKDLIEENKQAIKYRTEEILNERFRKTDTRKKENRKPGIEKVQNLDLYIRTNRLILWVMLIPVFLILLFIIFLFTNR